MNYQIPYVNLAAQHRMLKKELLEAMEPVLESGHFILGDKVSLFEKKLADLCQVKQSIGVANGTDALMLALRALGVGIGDEVITVPNSFVATASCIRMVGAKVVFVDVDKHMNMDASQLAQKINLKTKVILPVHLTGRPADMNEIGQIAKKSNVAVVEDCAQAIAASIGGRPVGSFGEVGCFSFHPLKNLSACGDAGALVTNRKDLAERLTSLRNLGLKTRENCVEWSVNSRLDTMQAAILLAKWNYLESWTKKRIEHVNQYRKYLKSIAEVVLPNDSSDRRSVYHTFIIQVPKRDALKQYLAEQGIETAIHYPIPIHLQEAAKELGYRRGDFPMAESQAEKILSLPIYPELTVDQIEKISGCIQKFYRGTER